MTQGESMNDTKAVEDILTDPLCEPWRPVAVEEKVRAMVSVPP